jgi:hypothetical protein
MCPAYTPRLSAPFTCLLRTPHHTPHIAPRHKPRATKLAAAALLQEQHERGDVVAIRRVLLPGPPLRGGVIDYVARGRWVAASLAHARRHLVVAQDLPHAVRGDDDEPVLGLERPRKHLRTLFEVRQSRRTKAVTGRASPRPQHNGGARSAARGRAERCEQKWSAARSAHHLPDPPTEDLSPHGEMTSSPRLELLTERASSKGSNGRPHLGGRGDAELVEDGVADRARHREPGEAPGASRVVNFRHSMGSRQLLSCC